MNKEKNKKNIHVLYVDDEYINLLAFTSSFRRFFNVYTALSAKEADKILSKKNIHVLITDHRMPIKTGTELLEEAVRKYPDLVRILLTAYVEDAAVKDAVKRELVFIALEKPWDFEELKASIEKGYEIYLWEEERRKAKEEIELSSKEVSLALQKKDTLQQSI